jgi:hypothetical protein
MPKIKTTSKIFHSCALVNDWIIVVVWLVIPCSTFLFELISRIKRSVFFIVRRTFIFSVVTTFDFWRHTVELTFYFNVWKPAFYFSGKAEYFTRKPIVRTVLTSVLLICINKMHNSNAMQMRYLPVVCTVFKDVYYSYISQMHNDPTQWRNVSSSLHSVLIGMCFTYISQI